MHSLILGMTESGKTTLAKKLARQLKANGVGVIVLDPLADPGWHADEITQSPAEFLDLYWGSRSCACFIDEAGDNVGRFDDAMIKTATKGRHWGHMNFYISQRGTLISRTVRDQCGQVFLFNTAMADSKIHANEWNCPEFITAPQLQKGAYFSKQRFTPLNKGKIF